MPGNMLQSALVGAVAQELVKGLSKAIQQQSQYAIQFQSQFKELKEQLSFMQSFVADAEKIKENKETVKTTLSTLRELIYEADDLVVDCQIRADHQKLKESYCFLLSLSEILFRYRTGKGLTDINKQITRTQENLKAYYRSIVGHSDSESSSKRSTPYCCQYVDQSEIVGLTDDAAKIRNWILAQHEPLLRIGIVGMGGLGKTTLAKMICRDGSLNQQFQMKIWVSVSQTVNEADILRSILKQLEVDDCGFPNAVLLNRISQLLSNKTYVIVFDDVWDIDGWWERISSVLPKTKGHSNCVIITSRIKKVVKRMGVKEARIHQPRLLDDTESWKLFCAVYSTFMPIPTNSQLVEKGKEIVNKCGGLPLAIKTIGGMLPLVDQSFGEWDRICNCFHEKLMAAKDENSDGSHAVIASLRLSYDELPARLKHCLLCFSIYPEDYEIDAEQLIRWWQGEGFVRGKSTETATESAFDCLAELVSRCLVEVSKRRNFDGKISTCKVHDMVRDMIIKISKEEGFCSFEDGGKHIADKSSRRLGVTNETLFQSLRGNSKLRALLLTTVHFIGFDKDIALAKVKSLRVLDLSNVILDGINVKDFWCWISSLKRLAYLNLRNVQKLIHVPQSIRQLWGLQVLILGECKNLKMLPKCITSLPRLTVLDVGDCPCLQFLPEGFWRLSNLQELYGLKIGGPAKGCRFGELKALTELRVLQVDITEDSTIEDQELTVLEGLTKLRVFSIHAGDSEDEVILGKLDNLAPPKSIQELYLKHFVGETTPAWINPSLLQKLQFLCIEDSRVKGMNENFWGDENCKWNVRSLSLKVCQTLQVVWEDLLSAMPAMEYIEVSQCSLLETFPCDFRRSGTWDIREKKKKDAKAEGACSHEH